MENIEVFGFMLLGYLVGCAVDRVLRPWVLRLWDRVITHDLVVSCG